MRSDTSTIIASPAPALDAAWSTPHARRLDYIDGMRAIAIVAVVCFHAHIPGFSGGFVGVDIFFVISGFLITHQIVSQSLDGRFSMADFYARRILRIFPPLLLVTVATLALATACSLLPQERRELAMSAAATAAMVSNYFFSSGTEYFSSHSEVNPLLHTWSLGVEEQYYLFVPAFTAAILVLAKRRKWRPVDALLGFGAVAIVASYVALAILTNTDHRLAFFSIITRSWQFATGGILAIAVIDGIVIPERLRSLLGVAGLLAIAAPILLYDQHVTYPGYAAAAVPTCGALLLLASGLGNKTSPLVRLLSSPPAVAVGLLSYSWYLWHWPLVELGRTLAVGQDSIWKDIAASAAAFALAIPTYLFLERPLKRLRRPEITRRRGGRVIIAGAAGSAAVALLALFLTQASVINRHAPKIDMGRPTVAASGCQPNHLPSFSHVNPCVVGATAEPSAVFWGDSHATMLIPVADWSGRAADRAAVVFGKNVCPPLLGIEIDFFVRRTCAGSNDELLAWIRAQATRPITGVVLAGAWSRYNGQEIPAGGTDLTRMLWRDPNRPEVGYADMFSDGLSQLLTALGPGRRVLIVGQVPEFKHAVVHCLMRAQLNGQGFETCALERLAVEHRRRDAIETLQRVAARFPNVRLIDPLDVFCDRDTCRPFGPDGVYYEDDNHITELGAEKLYRHFQADFRWVYGPTAGQ
jgi:peptidoglycan/LPS O-acetylase OafA/YrhL